VSRALLLAALVLSTSCVPWYRSDEVRALRADDPETMAELLAPCDDHVRQGRAGEAADCFRAALKHNPLHGGALVGFARALLSAERYLEARAVARHGLKVIAGDSGSQTAQALATVILESFARQGLYALALEQAAEREAPTLAQAAQQYPRVFGKLASASAAAHDGEPRVALERYAAWLADYGVADHPIVRAWSDEVRQISLPQALAMVARGDREAAAGNWIGAIVAYGQAYRYLPSKLFAEQVKPKVLEAAGHLADPSWLSPLAVELADRGDALVHAGELGEALQAYRRAVATAPYWAEARHNLAVLLASVEMQDEAVRQMDWFLALAPSSPLASKARALRDGWAAQRESAVTSQEAAR
jgi:predicted Zn-dependent protease